MDHVCLNCRRVWKPERSRQSRRLWRVQQPARWSCKHFGSSFCHSDTNICLPPVQLRVLAAGIREAPPPEPRRRKTVRVQRVWHEIYQRFHAAPARPQPHRWATSPVQPVWQVLRTALLPALAHAYSHWWTAIFVWGLQSPLHGGRLRSQTHDATRRERTTHVCAVRQAVQQGTLSRKAPEAPVMPWPNCRLLWAAAADRKQRFWQFARGWQVGR